MSRQQWGNGYWSGVDDAINGAIKTSIEEQALLWICHMGISNEKKENSRLVFPVRDFIVWCAVGGFTKRYAKRIYDYILNNEPYGCYVSGEALTDWVDDSFILPRIDSTWLEELKLIESKRHAR